MMITRGAVSGEQGRGTPAPRPSRGRCTEVLTVPKSRLKPRPRRPGNECRLRHRHGKNGRSAHYSPRHHADFEREERAAIAEAEMATLEFSTRKLQSSDAEERRRPPLISAAQSREAIPLLLRTLSDADWRVRKTAVEALIALGGDDVIQGLIQCLSAHDNAGARNSRHRGARSPRGRGRGCPPVRPRDA